MNKAYIHDESFAVGKSYAISSDAYPDLNFKGKLEKIERVIYQGDMDSSYPDPEWYYRLNFLTSKGENFTVDGDLIRKMLENGLGEIDELDEDSGGNEDPVKVAVQFALDGMFTDGGHHKQWYLKQILKTLLTPEEYAAKVIEMAPDYGWDEGIAP